MRICCIEGTLTYHSGTTVEAAADAEVRVFKDGKLILMTATNQSGDFAIMNIPANSGTYKLHFVFEEHDIVCAEVAIGSKSLSLGTILLRRSIDRQESEATL